MNIVVRISTESLDPVAEARAFASDHRRSGAIVTFTGQVRDEGGTVEELSLEHYPNFTEEKIRERGAEAVRRWSLDGAWVIHRVGKLIPGEPIVFVAAGAAHRRAAFAAVDFLMDYLKTSAPLWKKEISNGEPQWIEPRAEDYADAARWNPTGSVRS
jgi:molybdopterin synthase catalytic subunit